MNVRCEPVSDVKELIANLSKIDYDLSQKIKSDSGVLIRLADEMAESATNFNGQGYKSFLDSREKFVQTLCTMNKDYTELMSVLRCKY